MAVEDLLDIFGSDPFGRDYLYGLGDMGNRQGLAPYGFRYAENLSQPTTTKKSGYLGDVGGYVGDIGEPRSVMSELSASSEIGGRTVQYPLIVPTLTADELMLLHSGGKPTPEIYDKAQSWAVSRLAQGQDPFATPIGLRYPQPEGFNPVPNTDRVQESPQSSGLLGGVLPYIYSRADALKRTLGDVVSNPMASTEQVVNNANDRARYLNQLNAQVASQGVKGLMSPQGQELARLYADAYNPVGMTAKSVSTKIGINVNQGGSSFADKIISGEKKFETRESDSLRSYVGKRVGIIRTGEGKAKAIGDVTLGEPIVVSSPEEFAKLRDLHLVPEGSKFDIKEGGVKYLYPIENPVPYGVEKDVAKYGIVSRKILGEPDTLEKALYPQQAALDLAQQRAALPVEQGGLGLPVNNTAADRAKAMGFDVEAYRGSTAKEISHTNPIWWTEDPSYANTYAAHIVRPPIGQPDPYSGNVMPLLVKIGNEKQFEKFNAGGVPLDPFSGFSSDIQTGLRRYPKNDLTGELGGKVWEAVSIPENVRSRFAAFDPFRKDVATATAMGVALPDLLAQPVNQYQNPYETLPMYTDPFGNTIGSSIR